MKISLKEDINSVSYFKSNFNKILDKMCENHRPMILTQNGKSAGVFLDIETWENILKQIQVLKKINEGERSLQNDKIYSMDDLDSFYKEKYGI